MVTPFSHPFSKFLIMPAPVYFLIEKTEYQYSTCYEYRLQQDRKLIFCRHKNEMPFSALKFDEIKNAFTQNVMEFGVYYNDICIARVTTACTADEIRQIFPLIKTVSIYK